MGRDESIPRHRGAAALKSMLPGISADALERLGRSEAAAFLARLELQFLDVYEPLAAVYGATHDVDALAERLVRLALRAAQERPADLRELDRRREIDPHWYQRARMIGYVCYVDKFCGTLSALPERLDYLAELEVSYLHLMPVLAPRPGENDGGYAVMD